VQAVPRVVDAVPRDITILIVAESRLYAESLAHELDQRGFTTVFAAPADARTSSKAYGADVVLVDVRRIESLGVLRQLAASPGARVVAIDLPEGDVPAFACAEAGAIATVSSSATVDKLTSVLSSAAAGHAVFAPSVVTKLARRVAAIAAARRSSVLPSGITRRELQVLELIDVGLSNKEIASRLSVELQTVKNHVHSILRKLDVQRRAQAAAAFRAAAGFDAAEVLRAFTDRL
jgi:DNA-binding NarL/FixJ family response regulator